MVTALGPVGGPAEVAQHVVTTPGGDAMLETDEPSVVRMMPLLPTQRLDATPIKFIFLEDGEHPTNSKKTLKICFFTESVLASRFCIAFLHSFLNSYPDQTLDTLHNTLHCFGGKVKLTWQLVILTGALL
jgi:hypothetical protein